jgi:hypothetical protein
LLFHSKPGEIKKLYYEIGTVEANHYETVFQNEEMRNAFAEKRETADRRSLCSAVDVNQRYVERDVPPPIITQAPRDIFYAPGRLYGVKIRVPGSKAVRRCRRATPRCVP